MKEQGEYMIKHVDYMRKQGESYIHKKGKVIDNVLWHSDSDNDLTHFDIIYIYYICR